MTQNKRNIVWIVDDELELAELCVEALSSDPIDCTTFATPEEALEKLKNEATPVDLFVTDFRLPAMNGVQYLKALREKGINKPVILMSAATDREQLIQAANLSLTAFLEKPFSFETFRSKVLNSLQNITHLDVDAEIMGLMRTHTTRLEETLQNTLGRMELFKIALKDSNPDSVFAVENSPKHYKLIQNERRLLNDIENLKKKIQTLWEKSDFSK